MIMGGNRKDTPTLILLNIWRQTFGIQPLCVILSVCHFVFACFKKILMRQSDLGTHSSPLYI